MFNRRSDKQIDAAEGREPSSFFGAGAPEALGHETAEEHHREPLLGITGWIGVAVLTVLLAMLIRLLIFQSYRIPSESMLPTLKVGDHIIVSRFHYGYRVPYLRRRVFQATPPQRFDVIVFAAPPDADIPLEGYHADYFIKRVVGLPGETVLIRNFQVHINGVKLEELDHIITSDNPLVVSGHRGDWGPITLGKDEYYVLGDNRPNSKDSRYFGPVRMNAIEGRAELIYWSWKKHGAFDVRWQRIGKRIR